MSKPTHILVPIVEISKYDPYYPDDIVAFVANCPKVDLSEEGIKNRAYKEAKEMTFIKDKESFDFGYQQCAKDLLNTKP